MVYEQGSILFLHSVYTFIIQGLPLEEVLKGYDIVKAVF